MRFLLLRQGADGFPARHAGGAHGFACMATTLAEAGHEVHMLYTACKASAMHTALLQGTLSSVAFSTAVDGVVTWVYRHVKHHVSLLDVEETVQGQLSWAVAAMAPDLGNSLGQRGLGLPNVLERLVQEAKALAGQQQQAVTWLILDADGSQQPPAAGCCTLLEACSNILDPKQLLLLVQNVHFLPLGPLGTAARSQTLLQAWQRLGGIMCVSHFVAKYVAEHAAPLGLRHQQIQVAHYATWQAFGEGPFPDYGAGAAKQLAGWRAARVTSNGIGDSSSSSRSQQSSWRPVIGCLKLTPEKGGQLFLSLAQQLPELQFLAVCTDQQLLHTAARLPNVRMVPPVPDIDELLQHMTLLLAPSIWQEAYGMVVTDALLRGLPVIVSNQGGLEEAAMGVAAAVVPVTPLHFPLDDESGDPSWALRVQPEDQPVQLWVQAILQVLQSQDHYKGCSRTGRSSALQLLAKQQLMLQQLLEWMQQLI
jgi:hypothetical protein